MILDKVFLVNDHRASFNPTRHHVASDVGTGMKYLPPESYGMQGHLDSISTWTNTNLMKLNEAKCNYSIFTRTKDKFVTRLSMNDIVMDRTPYIKILGVWISEDLSWDKNCQEISKKACA